MPLLSAFVSDRALAILRRESEATGRSIDDLASAAVEEAALAAERQYPPPPCGHSEPESDYRDPDTGAHRTARCEGGWLVVRGNGHDSTTDGHMFISSRRCPKCAA